MDLLLQEQRTKIVAPIVMMELGIEKTNFLTGNKYIFHFNVDTNIISISTLYTKMPLMAAQFLGKNQKGTAIWQPISLPSVSPGITDDLYNILLEMNADMEARFEALQQNKSN